MASCARIAAGFLIALMAMATLVTPQSAHAQAQVQRPDQEAPPAQAAGEDAGQLRYQQKVADAVAEHDRGNWAEARALFQEAHALSPSARTWRTLGMTAFELRDYVSALRELSASLQDPRRALDAKLRSEVEALLDRTRAFVGRFHVAVEPTDARLFVDDVPAQLEADGALLLGLGDHRLRAERQGYAVGQRALRVAGREDARVEWRLESDVASANVVGDAVGSAPPRSRPVALADSSSGGRVLTWVAVASAVALTGAAVGLRLASDSDFDHLKQQCRAMPGGACQPGAVDDSKLSALETLSTASVIAAGVSAVAAAVLFFVEGRGDQPRATLAVDGRTRVSGRF